MTENFIEILIGRQDNGSSLYRRVYCRATLMACRRPQLGDLTVKTVSRICMAIWCCVGAVAGADELVLDFDTDPNLFGAEFLGSAEWRNFGGVDNSGYLSVTDNFNSQIGAIVFPDLGGGQDVTAFSISADLRVGGGTAPPADGFSFNFVRPTDRLLDDEDEGLTIDSLDGRGNGWAEIPPHPGLYLPEEGSQSGLAIMFDTYQNGPAAPTGDCTEINPSTGEFYDCIGIGVRIDNELITATSLPDINGAFDNQDSLTTNVDDEYTNNGIAPFFDLNDVEAGEGLTWARLEIEYSQSGNLFVAYKGRTIIDEQVEYAPSPGLLVFGGRTGGANAFHHIDNVTLRTNEHVGGGVDWDFDNDGVLGVGDLDLLGAEVRAQTNAAGFDVTGDGVVDVNDIVSFVEDADKLNTYVGDSNLDGEFNSADLVAILASGTYEADVDAVWTTGDFTGDGRTNSADLVAALAGGGYELGPRAAIPAVPEPSGLILTVAAMLGLGLMRRDQRT
jgi:hypothetical protein